MRRQTAGEVASQDGADSKRVPDVKALGAMSRVRGRIRVAHCHLTDQAGRSGAARQWKLDSLSLALHTPCHFPSQRHPQWTARARIDLGWHPVNKSPNEPYMAALKLK